jgi:hypothetical protein
MAVAPGASPIVPNVTARSRKHEVKEGIGVGSHVRARLCTEGGGWHDCVHGTIMHGTIAGTAKWPRSYWLGEIIDPKDARTVGSVGRGADALILSNGDEQ